jgi:DNA replication and repair protein RecF
MADRFAALRVERLVVRGFRNLEDLDLAPGPRFNVVSGDNGQGKSNLLEAIYYLGALRSFRGAGREDLIAHAGSRAVLAARFSAEPAPIAARVGIDRDKARQLALNDKRPRSTASWVGAVPMVLFHPGDVALAGGSPESRRGFLDRILEQMDPTYPGALAAYTKALRSRNRLLKMGGDRRAIVAYDELLASSGAIVGQARRQLAQDLAPRVGDCFASVAGEELALEVAYRPRVDPSVASIRAASPPTDRTATISRSACASDPRAITRRRASNV